MAFGTFLQRLLRVNAATPYSWTLPTADAVGALCSDGAGTLSLQSLGQICQGRLTLTTGLPVTVADVSAATSVYYTPCFGNRIALYDGAAAWNVRAFNEITIALAAFTASKNYDIFAYDNAGVVTIETLVWTNDTTRATALTLQNGIWVKSGATTRRYLGTIYINSSGGQTDDSYAKRNVYNHYNRESRPMGVVDATASWNYTTATFRQARATATNQLECVVGVAGIEVDTQVYGHFSNTAAGNGAMVAIGEDSTTTIDTKCLFERRLDPVNGYVTTLGAALRKVPAAGRHTYVWLEYSDAAGTTTFYGESAGVYRSGIAGTTQG